jgi:hypothetical protein
MTAATLQTEMETPGRWRMHRPDTNGVEHTPEGGHTHGAGQGTPGLLSAHGVPPDEPAGGPYRDAAQAVDAARAATHPRPRHRHGRSPPARPLRVSRQVLRP